MSSPGNYLSLWIEGTLAIPQPNFSEPTSPDFAFHANWERIIVYQEQCPLVVYDAACSGEIVLTEFFYSTDGVNWNPIAGGNEVPLEPDTESGLLRLWETTFDMSGLDEGIYFLKAVMTNEANLQGEGTIEIYYDPTPPIPIITSPLEYMQEISGIFTFSAETVDENVQSFLLEILMGSHIYNTQQGLGNVEQGNVGNGNSCAATSCANAMNRLNSADNNLFGDKSTEKVAEELYGYIGGSKTGKRIEAALNHYLKKRGLTCSNPKGYHVHLEENKPTWKYYNDELRKGEAVIVLTSPGVNPNTGEWETGHALAGAGSDVQQDPPTEENPNPQPQTGAAFNDPNFGRSTGGTPWTTGQDGWGVVKLAGPDGWVGTNDDRQVYVYGIIAISSKQDSVNRSDLYNVNGQVYMHCCEGDSDPTEDGYQGSWDTNGVKDGFYTFRYEMEDETDVVGRSLTFAYIDNTVPDPVIVSPLPGQPITGQDVLSIVVHEITEAEDIHYTEFYYTQDGITWELIGIDTVEQDGWVFEWDISTLPPGPYTITAVMVDYGGNEGESLPVEILLNPV